MEKIEIYELKDSALNHLKGGALIGETTHTNPGETKEVSKHDRDVIKDYIPPGSEIIG